MNKIDTIAATLDRREALPALIGRHEDFLIVSGLAGAAQDVAEITAEADSAFMFGGAMGGATMAGLGLALAQPQRKVLVVTGDGDLLMSLGSLATIATQRPQNLAIICIDNAHYGETGNQETHTAMGVDLAGVARACGFDTVMSVSQESALQAASAALRETGPTFVLLRVTDGPSRRYRRNWDAVERKLIFRNALLAKAGS